MNINGYVACICEGSAERAIIDLLLKNDRLIFSTKELLEGEIIRCRDGKTFESKHLRKGFKSRLNNYRVNPKQKKI